MSGHTIGLFLFKQASCILYFLSVSPDNRDNRSFYYLDFLFLVSVVLMHQM